MSTQRKLTALLHELQHARSPLAQARVLARAWRTVRDLSPTDRRLLARHAGFDGAEDLLEGLGERGGGLAPAMLLRVLANARGTDGSTVSELLAAVRDPQRRDEAISMGAELAGNLLAEAEVDDGPEEVEGALEELQAVEVGIIETPEAALAALNALDGEQASEGRKIESGPVPESNGPSDEPTELEPAPSLALMSEPILQPPPPALVDWSRWRDNNASRRPAPTARETPRQSVSDGGSRPFEARTVLRATDAGQTVLFQLRNLRRAIPGLKESNIDNLRELIEDFRDGWARRRALCALFESGIPSDPSQALELVASLEREFDRRWCLGILAQRGDLRGTPLDRALDLLDSDYSKRRLVAIAG